MLKYEAPFFFFLNPNGFVAIVSVGLFRGLFGSALLAGADRERRVNVKPNSCVPFAFVLAVAAANALPLLSSVSIT